MDGIKGKIYNPPDDICRCGRVRSEHANKKQFVFWCTAGSKAAEDFAAGRISAPEECFAHAGGGEDLGCTCHE